VGGLSFTLTVVVRYVFPQSSYYLDYYPLVGLILKFLAFMICSLIVFISLNKFFHAFLYIINGNWKKFNSPMLFAGVGRRLLGVC
jgi:hypothetical protein